MFSRCHRALRQGSHTCTWYRFKCFFYSRHRWQVFHSYIPNYCWWKKSCTTWDIYNPCNQWDKLPFPQLVHAGFLVAINSTKPTKNLFSVGTLWIISCSADFSGFRKASKATLQQVSTLDLESVAFPYQIGCGLAGVNLGRWPRVMRTPFNCRHPNLLYLPLNNPNLQFTPCCWKKIFGFYSFS